MCSCKTYIIPSTEMEGRMHVVKDNKLYFQYYEHYQVNQLDYKIYDQASQIVRSQTLNIRHGLNHLWLDVSSLINGTDFYTLEIINPKGEKHFIRFQ
ncbi:MAG: hypothetical protein AAF806_18945 [Bacteroidota bacterium]